MIEILAGVGGYLIGTISFTRIVAHLLIPHEDITVTLYDVRGTDSTWTYRGVSASSLFERLPARWSILVIVLDALKAFAPTMAFRLAVPDSPAVAIVAVAVVAGHVWPIWWRGRGGRGQSCMLGAVLAIDVLAVPAAIIIGAVVGLVVFTSAYMARNMSAAGLIPWFWWSAGIGAEFWFAVAVNVIYWLAAFPDLVEEVNALRARGITAMPYGKRLGIAWHDFLHEKS